MQRSILFLGAALGCALLASCAAGPAAKPAERLEADALAAELLRLETEVPGAPEHRTDERERPRACAPREIPRPLTAVVTVREAPGGALRTRETFRLSPAAVSCTDESGAEWWLARNPRYPDELEGAAVRPAEHLVLAYTAGDLRLTGLERLWERCAALGGANALPEGLRRSSRVESRFGLEFESWEAADEDSVLREVWWNAEHALALRVVLRDARGEFVREIEALEWSVAEEALRHPAERHPGWARLDLSDWHDACGPTHAGHDHAEPAPDGSH